MPKDPKLTRGMSLQLKTDYKKRVDKAARQLSDEADERITTAKVVYTLIDNYLEQAMDDIRKEF